MKLFIPPLGTEILLTKDLRFNLFCEYRNRQLWDLVSASTLERIPYGARSNNSVECFLPKGTRLKIDRVFIRKGAKTYDSVTFRFYDLIPYGDGVKYNGRFWMKLEDANRIECEVIDA